MIQEKTRQIAAHVSELRLKNTLERIAQYHRIQASPGYEQAAGFCVKRMREAGMDAELLYYPASQNTSFQTFCGIEAWSCRQAWCELEETGERIADFAGDPLSVIQRSAPWLRKEQRLEIIEMNRGAEEKAYEDIDFKGKLIFVHDSYTKYKEWAVDKRGAVGILSDCVIEEEGVSERYDQLDCRRYTSFWWTPQEKRTFGFVLSPRDGDRLARLCREKERKGEYPAVYCYMNSTLGDGEMCNAMGFIPGSTEEEVILSAHLCHPRSSANDNASGVSAAVEAVCLLQRLIREKKLSPPARGIRVLLIPEYAGTYAYLDSLTKEQRKRISAAFNLDMVGGRQDGRCGPLILHETPHSTPSIVNAAAQLIFDEVLGQVRALNAVDRLPMINGYVSEFIDGSDHAVYNDPACNIPAPLLCQWPDRFYHTSGDTLAGIDLKVLQISCALAASFGYCMASLAIDEVPALLAQNRRRMTECLERLVQDYFAGRITAQPPYELGQHYHVFFEASAKSAAEFFRSEEKSIAENMAAEAVKQLECSFQMIMGDFAKDILPASFTGDTRVPTRSFFGPASFGGIRAKAGGEEAYKRYHEKIKNYDGEDFTALTVFYIDGVRTVETIVQQVALDLRLDDTDPVRAYLAFLQEVKLIQMM